MNKDRTNLTVSYWEKRGRRETANGTRSLSGTVATRSVAPLAATPPGPPHQPTSQQVVEDQHAADDEVKAAVVVSATNKPNVLAGPTPAGHPPHNSKSGGQGDAHLQKRRHAAKPRIPAPPVTRKGKEKSTNTLRTDRPSLADIYPGLEKRVKEPRKANLQINRVCATASYVSSTY